MKTRDLMLAIGTMLMIGACQKDEVLAPATMSSKSGELPTSAASTITDVRWTLLRLDRSGKLAFDGEIPWFRLSSRTGDVSGFTACNEVVGLYRLAGDRLTFLSLSHTRRYCGERGVAELETRYFEVLALTDRFRVEADVLTLMHGNEDLAEFTLEPSAATVLRR